MATQTVIITGGPSRLHLMLSVFDTEIFRLSNFRFELKDGDRGSANVWINGATLNNREAEEYHLNGYFMPQGVDTPMKDMVMVRFIYSSQSREGIIDDVSQRCLVGHPAPDVLDLITWGA